LNAVPVYVRPVPAVVVATPTHVPFTRASVCPFEPVKRDEVAIAPTSPVVPEMFPRMELGAIWVKFEKSKSPVT
jgi:hypothetical protein